jgi:hypothetical protein
MLKSSDTLATKADKRNTLEPATAPVVNNGADDLEAKLARIMVLVPPIITLPKPKQKCPYTGQSRTSLLEMVAPGERNGHKPPVRAIYRRSHKHAVRGKWLIPSENLFRYLLSLEADSVAIYSKLAAERKLGGLE